MSDEDDFRLDGKIALVTGASRGLGLECAAVLASAGCSVMLTDIADEAGEAAALEIADAGRPAAYCRLDVTREDDWIGGIAGTIQAFGGLDILVNNARIEIVSEITQTSHADFRQVMAVNVSELPLAAPEQVEHRGKGPDGQRDDDATHLMKLSYSSSARNGSKADIRPSWP
jgi:NAD(P)-dependent dehydrogenase (short-subunit alcohol dehydrogenase family)